MARTEIVIPLISQIQVCWISDQRIPEVHEAAPLAEELLAHLDTSTFVEFPGPQSATRVRSGNLESPRHRNRRDPLPFIHNVVSAAKDEIADSAVRRRYRLDVPRVFPLAAAARTRPALPALTHAVRHTAQ